MASMSNLPSLVRRLRSSRRTEQLQAATSIARIAATGNREERAALANTSVISPLVQLLASGSVAMQKQAALVLDLVALESLSARGAIADSGGIAASAALLGSSSEELVLGAASCLTSLSSGSPELREAIAAAGVIPMVVQLCSGGSSGVRDRAATLLCSISGPGNTSGIKTALEAAGGIDALVGLLNCSVSASHFAHTNAAYCLANLAFHCPARQAAIAAAGGAAALVQQLRASPWQQAREAAAGAVRNLVEDGEPAACAAVIAAGGLDALAKQVEAGSAKAAQRAALALADIADGSPEQRSAVLAAGCIPPLVRLLGSEGGGAARDAAAEVLHDLSRGGGPAAAAVAAAAGCESALLAYVGARQEDARALEVAAALAANIAQSGQLGAAQAARLAPMLQRLCSTRTQVKRNAGEALQSLTAAMIAEKEGDAAAAVAAAAAVTAAAAAAGTAAPAAAQPVANQQQRPRPPRVCAAPGCGATTGLRRCGGCGAVRYCSAACSKAHWRAHKAECRRLQAERAAAAARSGD